VRKGLIVLAAILVMPAVLPGTQAPEPDPAVAEGVRLVNEGDFEAATRALEGAVEALRGIPGREQALGNAHLYLGVAAMGMGDEAAARHRFRAALDAHPDLKLAPKQLSAKIVRVFEEVRLERAATAKSRTRRTALKWGLLGATAGVGAGLAGKAVIGSKAIANRPPSYVRIGISPYSMHFLAGTTAITALADCTDEDGDTLTYTWDWGDGATATGVRVSHVYQSSGTFSLKLTATDPDGAQASGSNDLRIVSIAGQYRTSGTTQTQPYYSLDHSGRNWTLRGADGSVSSGMFSDPYHIDPFNWTSGNSTQRCEGEVAVWGPCGGDFCVELRFCCSNPEAGLAGSWGLTRVN
jgi:hypothetical protein